MTPPRPSWRRRLLLLALAVAALTVGALGGLAGWNLHRAAPAPQLAVSLPASVQVRMPAATPFPTIDQGSELVTDSVSGTISSQDPGQQVPIASIAKTMTALAVLQQFPLPPGGKGFTYTATAADVATYQQIIAEGGSYAPIEAGEVFTERQLLQGLMLPSANNYAVTLARYSAGSVSAFVARLNSMAASMGMNHTHFADPDGLSSSTTSTATDLVTLGEAVLAHPALMQIIGEAKATMPDGTVVTNVDPLVGLVPGWLGIKTGNTYAAGYCLLFAARVPVAAGQPPLTVVGVVLGQASWTPVLDFARGIVRADAADYEAVNLAKLAPTVSAQVSSAWGATASADLGPGTGPTVLLRLGQTVEFPLTASADVPDRGAPGQRIGTVQAIGPRGQTISWPIDLQSSLAGPGPLWHALHG